MNKNVLAAITTAINAYIQQEEQARVITSKVMPYPEVSPWRLFGLQELLRARTNWHVRRTNR